MTTRVGSAPSKEVPQPGRRNLYILLAILLVLLLIIAILWPVGTRVVSLATHLRALQQALDGDPLTLMAPEGRESLVSEFQGIEADLSALQYSLAPIFALTSRLGWVPYAGDTLQALPDMLDMALQLSTAATITTEALGSFDILTTAPSTNETPFGNVTQELLETLITSRHQLKAAGVKVQEAVSARERFSDAELLSFLAHPFEKLDTYLPLLSTSMQALQLAPDLMGATSPHTYLLVAQNSDELRATGGFISGIGILTISEGALGNLTFQDSYAVEDWSQPHPDPPSSLREYMLADLWTTRDANWWPDYPTSARAIQRMYALNQGISTDGVIAVDMKALELIIGALEPLVLEEKGEKITAANIRGKIYEFWAPPPVEGPLPTDWRDWPPEVRAWWAQRKDFMPMLSSVILERLQDVSSIDPGKLAYAIKQGLEEKHILLYFNDPATQQLLQKNGWDSAITPSDNDYLMVVDSNVGFNKANAAIAQSISYRIDLGNEDGPLSEVVLYYHHRSKARLENCDKQAQYEPTYEALIDKCYWDYVRVYAPSGSTLLTVEGADQYEVASQENGKTVFAAYFVLAPGENRHISFRYLLPTTILPEEESSYTRYLLQVQKQPGTLAIPLQVRIEIPPDTKALNADPKPEELSSEAVEYTTKLQIDRRFEVVLQSHN